MTTGEAAELRELYRKLVARPAEDIRAFAVEQRDAVQAKLSKTALALFRKSTFEKLIADANEHLARGDELRTFTDEDSRKKRRSQYGSAWLVARQAGIDLNRETAEGGDALASVSKIITAAPIVAGEVVDAAADAAKGLVSAGENVLYLVAGGLAFGAVLYGISKGRR